MTNQQNDDGELYRRKHEFLLFLPDVGDRSDVTFRASPMAHYTTNLGGISDQPYAQVKEKPLGDGTHSTVWD